MSRLSSKRATYLARKVAGLCTACAAQLQEDDGGLCATCAEDAADRVLRYVHSTKGKRTAARRMKRRRDRLQAAGLCVDCAAPRERSKRWCDKHADERTEMHARRRAGVVSIRRRRANPAADPRPEKPFERLLRALSHWDIVELDDLFDSMGIGPWSPENLERAAMTTILSRLVRQGLADRVRVGAYRITPAGRARLGKRRAA